LWAIGYDALDRAEEVRAEVARLGKKPCLVLLDTAVLVRHPDGCVTLDGEPFITTARIAGNPLVSFLAGLALAAPLQTSCAVGTLVRAAGGSPTEFGIDDAFIRDVERLVKPGSSVLFVLDKECHLDAILQEIRGLGGIVLKTNVDLERAKLIQSTLAAVAQKN
jgi:uncharacterized membrane protein